MPVRCTIHSSDVSTSLVSSLFGTTRAGRAEPTPRTQERMEAGVTARETSRSGLRTRRARGGGDARFISWASSESRLGRPRMRGHWAEAVGLGDHFANLAEKLLPHHVIPQFDRASVALSVGAAMGLDDDAVKPEEDAAAGPRPHFRPQRRERLAREQKTDSRHKAIAHRVADVLAELPAVPSAVFSAMLPVKPSVTKTSTAPLPRSSPSTNP